MPRLSNCVVSFLSIMAVCAWQPSSLVGQITDLPDAVIEQCLLTGSVGKKAGRLVGVTKPEHLKIECDAPIDSAVFKSLDEHRRGITRLSGSAEMNFTDSYKYERAAYLLDRDLDMNMVPVAVLRSIKGDDGALIYWIPNASTGNQLPGQPTGPQMAFLAQQKAVMRLFDALILNVDRRPDNWMVDNDTWKLYLIDHSRAFRETRELPEEFSETRARLSRDLYQRLVDLDEAELETVLDGLLTNSQIEALLARRDLIVEKIDQDRQSDGDAVVFTD